MQHRITKPSKLLDKQGELIQKGYATSPILKYCRKSVARKYRLKEWDYYLINNANYAVAFTVGTSASLALFSASFIDFTKPGEQTKSAVRIITNGKLSMPESSETGDIVYKDKEFDFSFRHIGDDRVLKVFWRKFVSGTDLSIAVTLSQEPEDSMVIATPFKEDKKDFYYNQKIIGMHAEGKVIFKDTAYSFTKSDSYGLLDWGRGVWPHHTTWYWSSAQGTVCGNQFGFNLGYGFGDTSAASENMLFYNGKANKLDKVTFHIPVNEKKEYEYMKPWKITSNDCRLDLVFEPILDRNVNLSAIILSTDQNQVFGRFHGMAILDDGTILLMNDYLGFAERVENRW